MAQTKIHYTENTEPLGGGRYLVSRSFQADGQAFFTEMEVNNPVYAFDQLDKWMDVILARIAAKQKAAA